MKQQTMTSIINAVTGSLLDRQHHKQHHSCGISKTTLSELTSNIVNISDLGSREDGGGDRPDCILTDDLLMVSDYTNGTVL